MKNIIRIILMISLIFVSCESDSLPPTDLEAGLIGYGKKNSSDPVLYKTTDGGETWRRSASNMSFEYVNFPSNEIGYGKKNSSDRVLYKTTDGGETWRRSASNMSFQYVNFPRN